MGWLWSGRGKPRSRPRVARAIVEAREAHRGAASDLGSATALMERAIWAHESSTPRDARGAGNGGAMGGAMGGANMSPAGAAPARRHDFGDVGVLLERAEDTARKLGRSRAEMWEEALRAWLENQLAGALDGVSVSAEERDIPGPSAAPRPWLFEARRQRIWGEIDETLGTLRSA
ncbi:MAG TPA: hypothetical protein VFQ25_13420 [Ktedonobacterales bacterium]|nr:hypothetical protein [Ktedonobacterales bacterium]